MLSFPSPAPVVHKGFNLKNVKVASFLAVGTDGKTYRINAFQLVPDARDTFDVGTLSKDPQDWQYFTDRSNGRVQRLGKGSYKQLDEDFYFTSTDPQAP